MASRFNFRVWDKKNKIFIYDFHLLSEAEDGFVIFDKEYMVENNCNNDYIIMQSTGLVDKNGKEIFENDILEDKEFEKYFIKYSDTLKRFTICAVDWPDEEDYCGDCDWDEYIREDFEKYRPVIIGNIYENKELLEK